MKKTNTDTKIRRVGGYLHRVVPMADGAGKVLSYALSPLMVEFRPRDLMQVVVGASILAVPVAFTEETWNRAAQLPFLNVLGLSLLSAVFIALFVYFNFYRFAMKGHVFEYCKRVAAIYIFSLLVVGIILTIIQKCDWRIDSLVALKQIGRAHV